MNLKVTEDLHFRLKLQAVKSRLSLQDLVTRWLEEKLGEAEGTPAGSTERRENARERFLALLSQSQAHAAASGLTPEELEREVDLAHDEAREILRARGR